MFDSSVTCCYLYIISKYGYPPPVEDTEVYLDEMKDLGFQSVELEGIHPKNIGWLYEHRERVAHKVQDSELDVPYFCVVLPELSSPDASVRDAQLAHFEKGCDVAQAVGAKGVLDNAPLPAYQFPGDMPIVRHYEEDVLMAAGLPNDLDWGRYWDGLVDTFRMACDIAKYRGLTYQMHPCVGVLSATTDGFLYFRDAVDRDNLRFNLDTANQFYLMDNPTLSLRRIVDYVDYIHLSDNRGAHVEHLPPGDGAMNWDGFFEAVDHVGFKGHFGVDVGGDESGVEDLDVAYKRTAEWIEERLG
ncbi:MAG: sugar phosphate isomerase/epimerase family protein [Candidatus Latescibacteria bacterium]|jgi:sugar phosphate isomerase/epimerase|nr:sugar phosphate isomerase/epimerase family protein [Candidatus Latescibacterota bacterium]